MSTKIVLKSKQVFEAFTEQGDLLGTFEKVSEWNGMTELRGESGTVIVHRDAGAFAVVFGLDETAVIIKAPADLIELIHAHKDAAVAQDLAGPSKPADVGKWRYWMPGQEAVECVIFWADQGFCAVYIDGKKQLPVRELKGATWERIV